MTQELFIPYSPERLREIRKGKKMSRRDVAYLAGIHPQSMTYYESQTHPTMPSVTIMARLGKALGINFYAGWE